MKLREVKQLDQGYTAKHWRQDWNSDLSPFPVPNSTSLSCIHGNPLQDATSLVLKMKENRGGKEEQSNKQDYAQAEGKIV